MPAPSAIAELVRRFREHHDVYTSGAYNETQLRRDFLDPFFAALGWDVHNMQDYAEAYREVIHEDAIKVGAFTKAPDYCFRVGGTRKFFVEAKKPSVNVKDDLAPAFQVRRYAWSAKLPLSILTDFEEFAVYDCRVKPDKNDKASTARIIYLTYDEFEKCWDEIAAIFSKEAILKGSFDKFAQGVKGKKGTAEVDAAFLHEIEGWREVLARNIALRNSQLSQRELNFAVQQTIDRIIFLRICEDRGMEAEGRLAAATNGANVYKRLCELFRLADNKYNSGLFHFRKEQERDLPDEMTLGLEIDDKPFKDIIKNLYYPDCPYEFSVISSDILGQVYEQFLGKVIRLTDGHRAVVEDKPEVKKAGGVFYTPNYIADYIVKNTVGKLLGDSAVDVGAVREPPLRTVNSGRLGKAERAQQKFPQSKITPKEAALLRILDIACGSGSFLIVAYQYLLDWHLAWYVANNPQKYATGKNPALYQGNSGDWKLTLGERKRILLDNIYGVDIDPQAVEVTKLSLLLKVLEGENEQTVSGMQKLVHTRVLPDLDRNIKCGNSLIGPDFYAGQQLGFFNDEERLHINVFDWKSEFPNIMKSGGFDAVIGNPPYIFGRETFSDLWKKYITSHYASYQGKYDLYIYFIEKGISIIKDKGHFAFIIPNTLLVNENTARLRQFILENTSINLIRMFEKRVFQTAQVESIIIVLQKLCANKFSHNEIQIIMDEITQLVKQEEYRVPPLFKFNVRKNAINESLTEKFSQKTKLGDLTEICIGIQLGGSQKNNTKESFLSAMQSDVNYKPVLDGKEINRYTLKWTKRFVNYGNWLHRKRDEKFFLNQKIMIRQIGNVPLATYDDSGLYVLNTIYNIIGASPDYDLRYFLGLINSKLLSWHWRNKASDFKTLFPKIKKDSLSNIPIHPIDFSDPADKARHDRMVEMVEQMLALNKQLAITNTAHEKTALQRQIDATDHQIDQLVYELYGMTEEEIRIVEGTT